ncbi:MAG TPA: PilT/PilU family type 4a pilus ATPase [Thermoanaerobaculia bacterium]|nr:PilT/PilU family type 4a pilus ATPase [Thermoanaerobaculia bacterium]
MNTKEILTRLANKDFATTDERDALLNELAATSGLRARDIVWMLFRPDRSLRDAATRILQKTKDAEAIETFFQEARGKPEAATRAAGAALFTVGIPGLEQRLAATLAPVDKPNAALREAQDLARKLILDAPPSKTLEPLLWQIEATLDPEPRLKLLERLANLPTDEKSLARWQRLAKDQELVIRERGLEYLAARAPLASLSMLAQQLPLVGYSTQQKIVDALSEIAKQKPSEVLNATIPLLASGEAATRSAVVKILLALPDRPAVVRRYIDFSKTLAGFVRERTIESLRQFDGDLVEPLIGILGDPDVEIRAAAIGIAASFEDKRLVEPLVRLLNDPDWWVRVTAADTLGRLKDPRAVDPLIACLADADARWSAIDALGRIGDERALPALGKLLGDPQPGVRIEAMRALTEFKDPRVMQALTNVATKDPDRAVRGRAVDLMQSFSAREHSEANIGAIRATALTAHAVQGDPRLHAMLIATRNQSASDLHIAVGQPPVIRIARDLIRAQGDPLTPEQTIALLKDVLTEAQWQTLEREHQLDFCYWIPNAGRYRGNVFFDHRGYSAVFRVIPEQPPTIDELGLPAHLAEIADYHQGLVIVCGPSGSGKSTTLAALVNIFNETRAAHVITMEDPIEVVHPFKNCLINQREVGVHTTSYARALRAALREDPDVIVIGELRDNESVSLALTAAETGHIVLGTLNSTSAPKAIDRIISSFPVDEQPQIRSSLSESLKFVVAQRLLPGKGDRRQVACFEVLRGTSSVASMIRDEKTYQIYSAMQIGRSHGMQTTDEALRDLLRRDQITPETAYRAAQRKEEFESLVSSEFLDASEV